MVADEFCRCKNLLINRTIASYPKGLVAVEEKILLALVDWALVVVIERTVRRLWALVWALGVAPGGCWGVEEEGLMACDRAHRGGACR